MPGSGAITVDIVIGPGSGVWSLDLNGMVTFASMSGFTYGDETQRKGTSTELAENSALAETAEKIKNPEAA